MIVVVFIGFAVTIAASIVVEGYVQKARRTSDDVAALLERVRREAL